MVSYAWYLSWNVHHKLIYQWNMVKTFLGISTSFKRFFKNTYNCFYPVFWPRPICQARPVDREVDRTMGWSTVQSTDVHRTVHVWQLSGAVDRIWEQCSLFISVDRAVDQFAPMVGFLTVGGRTTGRPEVCQTDRSA